MSCARFNIRTLLGLPRSPKRGALFGVFCHDPLGFCALLVAAAPLLLGLGCVRSEQPLVSEEESVIDADLLGMWETDFGADGEAYPVSIYPMPGSETVLEAAATDGLLELRTTKIGQERYVCFRYSEQPDLYVILRYELKGEAIRFYELDETVTYDAIRNGELSGTAWHLLWPNAQLSSGRSQMRAYLERHAQDRFCFHSWDCMPSMRRKK